MFDYIVYTDGGYSISNNVGSSAYVILKSDGQTLVGHDSFVHRRETSQRAELKAIIAAIGALPDHSRAQICTDNQPATQVLGRIPRRKTKPDIDLIVLYRQITRRKRLSIELKWVRHGVHAWNQFCDNLCTEALELAEHQSI